MHGTRQQDASGPETHLQALGSTIVMATEWMIRSWTTQEIPPTASDTTIVIAFAGLAGSLGGAGGRRVGDRHEDGGRHAGLPPHEFVNACQRAGANYSIFCRDLRQAWYLRGTPQKPQGGFDAVVAALQAEIDSLKPARILTLGASMGGYAAIRAGLALGADQIVAFAPQALVDSTARAEANLPTMPFDDLLRQLKRVLWMEGVQMTSLVESVGCSEKATAIEIHVGSREEGDLLEADMVKVASESRREAGWGISCVVHVHQGRDHNLVTAMRDTGELHELLARQVAHGSAA